jgi:hypothetical protein
MPTDGRRFVLHALVVLAILGVVLSTVWVVFWASFTLDSTGPSRTMVRQEALATTIGCALLIAALIPMRVAGLMRWVVVMDVVLAGLLGLLAAVLVNTNSPGTDVDDGNPWTWVFWMFLVTPTTWPVLALLVTTPWLRGRSRPGPRSVPAP